VHTMIKADTSWMEAGREGDSPETFRLQHQYHPYLEICPLQESTRGLVLAAGFWATGYLVTAAGLPAIGAFAHSVAVMQGTGCVLLGTRCAIYDPMCRKLIVEPFQRAASAVGSSIIEHLGLCDGGLSTEDVSISASQTDAVNCPSNFSSAEPALTCATRVSNVALELATCWVDLQNIPRSIKSAFQESPFQVYPCFGNRKPSAPDQNKVSGQTPWSGFWV